MSGIATILRYQGYAISGCDLDLDQLSIQQLKEIGCAIYQGNNTAACHDPSINTVVYSSAIRNNNPEINAAQQRAIPTIPRALMLAELMRMKYSIAIAGAHGKTTTTSLISHLLMEAQFDPTVIIGGHLKTISNNARIGNGDFLVAEADESDRSFLNLYATLAIITNIDLEHLETYKDLDDIKQTFRQFLSNLPFYGTAILCLEDENIRSILPISTVKTITYGLSNSADLWATDITLNADHSTFVLHSRHQAAPLGTITVTMPGQHNVLNTLAAIALAQELAIPLVTITAALKTFKGVERRFSYQGTYQGAELFDDYGHHPREIACTLKVAKKRARNKLIVVFQLHRYSRTHKLWEQFLKTFQESIIDHLIITDIHPASEDPIPGVTGETFAHALQGEHPPFSVSYAPLDTDFHSIRQQIERAAQPNDLILLLGAGKLHKLAKYVHQHI